MTATRLAGPDRRAPRLRADQRIGPYFTRAGRFRRIDPGEPRELPGLARAVGALGWAVLVGESFRRAVKRTRAAARATGDDGALRT